MSGYIVEVASLSPNATKKDVSDFFAFCGDIQYIEIVRSGEYGSTAYVTFNDAHSVETAVLLSGSTIVDQPVCIIRSGNYEDELDYWNRHSLNTDGQTRSTHSTHEDRFVVNTGEAVTVCQEVVKTMLAKGYILSKDALIKAKAFDESYHVSATAAAKVADLSKRVGLTDRINAGVGAVKSVDERYRVYDATKYVLSTTGRVAAATATTVVNSSYFAQGALLVSRALTKAAEAAADLAKNGSEK